MLEVWGSNFKLKVNGIDKEYRSMKEAIADKIDAWLLAKHFLTLTDAQVIREALINAKKVISGSGMDKKLERLVNRGASFSKMCDLETRRKESLKIGGHALIDDKFNCALKCPHDCTPFPNLLLNLSYKNSSLYCPKNKLKYLFNIVQSCSLSFQKK